MKDKTQHPCGSDSIAELEDRRRKSLMWWLGQAIAAYLGIAAVGASGNTTVGLIVFYALAVLVDIRELLSANTEAKGPRSGPA